MSCDIFRCARRLARTLLIYNKSQNMKTKVTILTAFLITISVIARVIAPFPGWDRLKQNSPNIIIAYCGKPTPPTPGILFMNAPASDSAIDVVLVLKGANNANSARLLTDHLLQQGENYLVFGYYGSGIYQAFEEYRVIPLGVHFSTNSIAGKSLDEQIQILFQRRLDVLNRQIKEDQEEKQRLEEGLKK
jgi:hypothetical protein